MTLPSPSRFPSLGPRPRRITIRVWELPVSNWSGKEISPMMIEPSTAYQKPSI
jgi:hypothetical protein